MNRQKLQEEKEEQSRGLCSPCTPQQGIPPCTRQRMGMLFSPPYRPQKGKRRCAPRAKAGAYAAPVPRSREFLPAPGSGWECFFLPPYRPQKGKDAAPHGPKQGLMQPLYPAAGNSSLRPAADGNAFFSPISAAERKRRCAPRAGRRFAACRMPWHPGKTLKNSRWGKLAFPPTFFMFSLRPWVYFCVFSSTHQFPLASCENCFASLFKFHRKRGAGMKSLPQGFRGCESP